MNSTTLCRVLFKLLLAAALLAPNGRLSAASEFGLPAKDSPDVAWWRDSRTNLDERLAWFRDARFGMFIHWGVYSSLGNEYHGRRGAGYAEHIQRVLKIPIPEYRREVAGNFNPTNFNADAWVSLAKQAGMKYIVITSKHHDGFAMWPTKVNDYNVMDATLWHHDPMADLRAACDRQGIKFGFYYSQAFDWGNSNAPGNDWDYHNPGGDLRLGGTDWWNTKPEFMESARKYVDTKAIPQLRELIKLYHPAILWFDTAGKLPPSENLRIMKAVREADPNVVISGRLVSGWGDYADTTDRPAEFPPHDGDWEAIPTTDESYGWNPFDNSHKPPSHFIRLLAKASARGGNVLMNIGPMGNGLVDPRDVTILQGIGAWWQVNGESIRGTTRTPLAVQAWGESTRKGDTLYLHVFDWPAGGRLVVGGLKTEVKSARLLANATTKLSVTREGQDVVVGVPATAPDASDSVVVLECDGAPMGSPTRLISATVRTNTLRAFDGGLEGNLTYGPGKSSDAWVGNWTRANDAVTWPARLNQKTVFNVAAVYDAPANAPRGRAVEGDAGREASAGSPGSGGSYVVKIGAHELKGTVHNGNNVVEPLGQVSLEPGEFDIRISSAELAGRELFRLRALNLVPVKE